MEGLSKRDGRYLSPKRRFDRGKDTSNLIWESGEEIEFEIGRIVEGRKRYLEIVLLDVGPNLLERLCARYLRNSQQLLHFRGDWPGLGYPPRLPLPLGDLRGHELRCIAHRENSPPPKRDSERRRSCEALRTPESQRERSRVAAEERCSRCHSFGGAAVEGGGDGAGRNGRENERTCDRVR